MHKDDGLVTPDIVRKVLASEDGDRYQRVRANFREREEFLAKNLKAWLEQELLYLSKKFPEWTRDELRMVAYLLERFFIRAIEIQRAAYALELNGSFKLPSRDPEDPSDPEVRH
jgi:hypothetical protein